MSSTPDLNMGTNSDGNQVQIEELEESVTKAEINLDKSVSLLHDVSKFLQKESLPIAASSPYSGPSVDIQELKMHLQKQDCRLPLRSSDLFLRPLPANDYYSRPVFSSYYRRHCGYPNPMVAYPPPQHCNHCSFSTPLCRSRSEPLSFGFDRRSSPNENNSSSSDKDEIPGILKKNPKPHKSSPSSSVENAKEINVYHSGGVLIMQHFKEPISDSEQQKVSEISAKLIEDCHKLTEGLKEVENKSEGGKMVQFDLSGSTSLEDRSSFGGSPVKDPNTSFSESGYRYKEQPSSLSTNDSLPWQPLGPSSPSSTASMRPPLEWDSGADVGYLDVDLSKEKLSTIERITLKGLSKQGLGEKRIVYKTSRGDRILQRIPSYLLEEEERKPDTKDTGCDPVGDPDSDKVYNSSESNPQTSDKTESTIQKADVSQVSQQTSSSDQPSPSPEMKDESTYVNTLGDEFKIPKPASKLVRRKQSPKIKKRRNSAILSKTTGKIKEILELAREGNSENESKVDELIVDHSFKGAVVNQKVPKSGLTSASSGSNITVLGKADGIQFEDISVQTSDRTKESKGVQANEKLSPKLTSCKSIQASGELNSLPRHLDTKYRKEMSGQEVRTKSTQFFGDGAQSLPKAICRRSRENQIDLGVELKEISQLCRKADKTTEPIAGSSGMNYVSEDKTNKSKKFDELDKLGHSTNSSKGSVKKKHKLPKAIVGAAELTKATLRQRFNEVDPSIIQKKYFDSQKREMVTRSTSMDVLASSHTATVGIQYSPRSDVAPGSSGAGRNDVPPRELWTDTLDSQASSTQTAHSWVHEGVPKRNSVVRPTRSFEYLPGEVYESRGNLRETLPSETSQNVITESSSSESDSHASSAHQKQSDVNGAVVSLPGNLSMSSGDGDVLSVNGTVSNEVAEDGDGNTVVIDNSIESGNGTVTAWIVLGPDVELEVLPTNELSDASSKSSTARAGKDKKENNSIAVQTETLNNLDSQRRGDDSLKRMIRDLCEILLSERRSRHAQSLDRRTYNASKSNTNRTSEYSSRRFSDDSSLQELRTLENVSKSKRSQNIPSFQFNANNEQTKVTQTSKIKKSVMNDLSSDTTDTLHSRLNNWKEDVKEKSCKKTSESRDGFKKEIDSKGIQLKDNMQESSRRKMLTNEGGGQFIKPQSIIVAPVELKVDKALSPIHLEVPRHHKSRSKKSHNALGSSVSPEMQADHIRACSTPYSITSVEGEDLNSGTMSSSTAAPPQSSYSSSTSGTGEISSQPNEVTRHPVTAIRKPPKNKSESRNPKRLVDVDTQYEKTIVNRSTQMSDDERFTARKNINAAKLVDTSTQMSETSLNKCKKCQHVLCICKQNVVLKDHLDMGTQMSDSEVFVCTCCRQVKSFCTNEEKEVSSKKETEVPFCSLCNSAKCNCKEADKLISTSYCSQCKAEKCICKELSAQKRESTLDSADGHKFSSNRKLPVQDEGKNEKLSSRRQSRETQVINGDHFENLDVDSEASSFPSTSSSSSSNPAITSKNKSTSLGRDKIIVYICPVCHCNPNIKQQCIFCPCHIDKGTHIPRCDCHEAIPKYLIPGFCKCHRRNLQHFKECNCSDKEVKNNSNANNCPCCETFYSHMRQKIYEHQLEEVKAIPKEERPTPRNYFLKLEETTVSKDASEISMPEKKPVEVVTLKIPVRRVGKAKIPSQHFYYAKDSDQSCSEEKEKEVEYVDDIIKRYSDNLSNRKNSGSGKSKGSSSSGDKGGKSGSSGGSSYKTLQEWLETNRPDFYSSAEMRRQVILRRAKERESHHAERDKNIVSRVCTVVHKPCPIPTRIFTTAELKQQTLKKCKQLSEVRQKKEEQKKKNEYRRNKLMADIFAKKLQLKTLRGQVNLSNSFTILTN